MKAIEDCRWYKEGMQAKTDGLAMTMNPYADGSPKWYIWNEGYKVTL